MGRAAGDKSHYTFGLIGPDGALLPEHIELVSVTTVIKAILGGPPPEWGFKVAVDGVVDLLHDGLSLYGLEADEVKALLKQRDQTPWAIRNLGGIRGSRVHGFLEALAKGEPVSPQDGYEQATLDWFEANVAEVVGTEQVVWSLVHRFCGTIDLLYVDFDGMFRQTDLKTHKPRSIRKPASDADLLQLGGYEIAYAELHPEAPIYGSSVVCVTEDGRYLEDTRGALPQGFLAVLDLYRELQGR